MPCQIIVSNNCNIPRAEFITIAPDGHVFTKNEGMQEWIASGESAEAWHRRTSKIIITDRTKDQLDYLRDPLVTYATTPPEKIGSKYSCKEPSKETAFYQSLLTTGEVTVTFSEFEPYIIEHT